MISVFTALLAFISYGCMVVLLGCLQAFIELRAPF